MHLSHQPYVESLGRGQTGKVQEQWQPQFLGKRLLFHVQPAVTASFRYARITASLPNILIGMNPDKPAARTGVTQCNNARLSGLAWPSE
jgi:hypothetical protein